MNIIKLKGIIRDIKPSHKINDIEYSEANLIVNRPNTAIEDIIKLKFKKFSNTYNENEEISLVGNIRSYSQKVEDKNKVLIYCFTYFDLPEWHREANDLGDTSNKFMISGTICKKDALRKNKYGKDNIRFIVANNIISENNESKLNSYLPCITHGKKAKLIDSCKIGDLVLIQGLLRTRYYKKYNENGEYDTLLATELYVSDITVMLIPEVIEDEGV